MVLRPRMAELVSSMFLTKLSIKAPLRGFSCLSCSISEVEVLRSIASRSEQRQARARVINIVTSRMSMLCGIFYI